MQRYAFDKIWFADNQKWLLWLLNAPVIKIWFRKVLGIKEKEKIFEIQPNNYKVDLGLKWTKKDGLKHYYKGIFTARNSMSERMFEAFYPVWSLMHTWDLFADRKIPQLSFGFSTLTQHPYDATAGIEGVVQRTGVTENWATIIAGAGNGTDTSTYPYPLYIYSHTVSGQFIRLNRYIMTFDTSSIGDDDTISEATIGWKGDGYKVDGLGITPNINVYGATPASNTALANSDYGQCGSTAFATAIAYADIASGYNNFTLNASGLANISKTGYSRFSFRNANYDVAGSAPAWSSDEASATYHYHDSPDGAKLVVTYTSEITINLPLGTLSLTGQLPTTTGNIVINMVLGTLSLIGNIPSIKITGWVNRAKSSISSWSSPSRNSSVWTERSKNTSSYTNKNRNT
jgi:hypothetical protein